MIPACLVFACGDPVTVRGRCARHAGQVDTARSIGTDRQVGAEFYHSTRWKNLRAVLLRRHPICTCDDCVRTGVVRVCSVAHHRTAHGGDRVKFFDVANLQAMAKVCHDKLTATKGRRAMATGASAARYVVTGAPGCGKSTWCRQHAQDGDLVWDFGVLASALSLGGRDRPRLANGSRGPWPFPTMKAMLTMRDALVAWLHTTDLYSTRVFMIVSNPVEAQRIATLIGAEVVVWTREQWEPLT